MTTAPILGLGRRRQQDPGTVFYGAHVRPGTYGEKTGCHYGVLRTVEDMYGLPYAGSRAPARPPITDAWQ